MRKARGPASSAQCRIRRCASPSDKTIALFFFFFCGVNSKDGECVR
ncbi:hypothetical protein KCP70_04365 [Salmonella enterica subsp. enterica]|nr:hypothetical protein KCP70_04365 [Salmonella enterica subsp. enterica]